MLSRTLRIGESIIIGEAVLIKVEEKSGRCVKLAIACNLSPIRVIGRGIDIGPIVRGITGVRPSPPRILEPLSA